MTRMKLCPNFTILVFFILVPINWGLGIRVRNRNNSKTKSQNESDSICNKVSGKIKERQRLQIHIVITKLTQPGEDDMPVVLPFAASVAEGCTQVVTEVYLRIL
jgi:cadmium resistance protein CadD (predicted permease)